MVGCVCHVWLEVDTTGSKLLITMDQNLGPNLNICAVSFQKAVSTTKTTSLTL